MIGAGRRRGAWLCSPQKLVNNLAKSPSVYRSENSDLIVGASWHRLWRVRSDSWSITRFSLAVCHRKLATSVSLMSTADSSPERAAPGFSKWISAVWLVTWKNREGYLFWRWPGRWKKNHSNWLSVYLKNIRCWTTRKRSLGLTRRAPVPLKRSCFYILMARDG